MDHTKHDAETLPHPRRALNGHDSGVSQQLVVDGQPCSECDGPIEPSRRSRLVATTLCEACAELRDYALAGHTD